MISFYTPINNSDKYKVDYQNVCDSVFYVAVPDIGVETLEEYGYVSLAEAAIFEYSFRLGARLIIEVQKDSED